MPLYAPPPNEPKDEKTGLYLPQKPPTQEELFYQMVFFQTSLQMKHWRFSICGVPRIEYDWSNSIKPICNFNHLTGKRRN